MRRTDFRNFAIMRVFDFQSLLGCDASRREKEYRKNRYLSIPFGMRQIDSKVSNVGVIVTFQSLLGCDKPNPNSFFHVI